MRSSKPFSGLMSTLLAKQSYAKKIASGVVLILILILVSSLWAFFVSNPNGDKWSSVYKILDHGKNEFGEVWIYDNQDDRCMTFDAPGTNLLQACMDLRDHNKLVFDTYIVMISGMYFKPAPAKILTLGLGGGMLLRAMNVVAPNAQHDVVEINPLVIEYVNKHFYVTGNEHLKIYNKDAMDFVRQVPDKSYDMVFVDLFDDHYIPEQFLTWEFSRELKRITKDYSVIIVNTVSITQEDRKKYFTVEGLNEDELFAKPFDHSVKLNSPSSANQIIISVKGKIPAREDFIMQSNLLRFHLAAIGINQQKLLAYLMRSMHNVFPEEAQAKLNEHN